MINTSVSNTVGIRSTTNSIFGLNFNSIGYLILIIAINTKMKNTPASKMYFRMGIRPKITSTRKIGTSEVYTNSDNLDAERRIFKR